MTAARGVRLAARSAGFRYSGADTPALAGVDVHVHPGEIVAVAGTNGCGKSTLCLLLAGVLPAATGDVTLDGAPLTAPAPHAIQFIQQTVANQVVAPTVAEDVAFGAECLGLTADVVAERVGTALAAVGLAGFEARAVATLSGGELARLALAGALAAQPRYLVADEPTAHLDRASADHFVTLLRRIADGRAAHGVPPTGVLLVTHRLEETRLADRLLLMRDGRVIARGLPRPLLYDSAMLAACGLTPPPAVAIAQRWRASGCRVPGAPLTAAELASACRA